MEVNKWTIRFRRFKLIIDGAQKINIKAKLQLQFCVYDDFLSYLDIDKNLMNQLAKVSNLPTYDKVDLPKKPVADADIPYSYFIDYVFSKMIMQR